MTSVESVQGSTVTLRLQGCEVKQASVLSKENERKVGNEVKVN